MNKRITLKPREKILGFICGILAFIACCHIFLIQPIEQQHSLTSTLLAQLQEDKAISKDSYTQALHTTNAIQSEQTQILTELTQSNALLHSILHQIYATQSNAFDNLDSLLNLSQNNHLALTHIQIANEELGVISLRGSGTFGGIAQFLHDIQTLHNQYVSLDFIHIALKDTLEFELLIQDMRI